MSYSFVIRAANKEDAKTAVAHQFDSTVAAVQPVHQKDRDAVVNCVHAMIDLQEPTANDDVIVNVAGHLAGMWEGGEITRITGGNFNVSFALVPRDMA